MAELSMKDGIPTWNVVEINECQPIATNTEYHKIDTIDQAIKYLSNNRFVNKICLGNNICSYNFTQEAFYESNWTKQTVVARGLFIDEKNNKIMARSYEKFFRINETESTKMEKLKETLKFPVTAYLKENGFLAIVSYDYNNDDLFIASKTTTNSEHAKYIKAQLEPYKEKLLHMVRANYNNPKLPMYSLVFECEDIENDPHIIEYDKSSIVLLDVIENSLEFKTVSYDALVNIAKIIGCPVKEKAFELNDWEAFEALYNNLQNEAWQYKNKFVEGFVFIDQNNFMTKAKTGYYNKWKMLRGVAEQTLKSGTYLKPELLITSDLQNFYKFCQNLYKTDCDKFTKKYPYNTDIISLRRMFYAKL